MTWDWNISKFIISTALSLASTLNPAFFVTVPVGEAVTEVVKRDRYKVLNSSTESFENKEEALRMIELTKDYQIDTAVGGLGSMVGEIAGKAFPLLTKNIGQAASAEIASQGGKVTQAARELIKTGQHLAKVETGVKWVSKSSSFLAENKNIIAEKYEKKVDEIIAILIIHENAVDTLKEDWEALKKEREYLLELNIQNIGLYIDKEEDISKHREVNERINRCLIFIREFQREIHNNNKCVSSECRFH